MNFHLPERKKRIAATVLCGSLLLSAGVPVYAFDETALVSSVFEEVSDIVNENVAGNGQSLSESGYALQRLGLVAGDETGNLLLEQQCTRAEALTIFISLQGESKDAEAVSYSHPFQDLIEWAESYVGYGLYKGYTAGCGENRFGTYETVTPEQYMTFVLKALGYTTDDFSWEQSLDKAVEIGLCSRAQAASWQNDGFCRQDIMEMSYLALNTNMKDGSCTLADKLIAKGKITREQAAQENLRYGGQYQGEAADAMYSDVDWTWQNNGSYEVYNVGTGLVMTANTAKQAGVTLEKRTGSNTKQQFTLTNNNDGGSFALTSTANTALAVDTSPLTGASAILWSKNGTTCQSFAAVAQSDGTYSLRLAHNTRMALTAQNGKVVLSTYTGSSDQLWKLNTPAVSTDDTAAATAKLASVMTVHPSGQKLGGGYSFAGASQCMGFGREVFYRMYNEQAKWNYNGSPKSSSDAEKYTITASSSSYSASSMKALISKAKPGDVLQMNTPKMHTMIFVSSDANGFTVYDANWVASNTVSVRYVKYGAWSGRNSSGITVLHATNYPKS